MEEQYEERGPDEGTPLSEDLPQPEEVVGAPSSSLVLVDAFKKASATPLTDEEIDILTAPIAEEEIDLHPTKGPYVPWVAYKRRMNQAFKPGGWSLVRMAKADFDPDLKAAALHMALLVQGRFIADAVGEFRQTGTMSAYDCLEAAKKSCLKRCCSDLGMFFELQDRRWKDQWLAEHAYRDKETRSDGSTYTTWKWKEKQTYPQQASPRSKPELVTPQQEGFVRKVEGPTATGGYYLTIETAEGSVRLLGNKSLSKYPDKAQLVDLLVSFVTKTVPQKGGGSMTVLDTLEVMGEES